MQIKRDNWLSNLIFETREDITDYCCEVWKKNWAAYPTELPPNPQMCVRVLIRDVLLWFRIIINFYLAADDKFSRDNIACLIFEILRNSCSDLLEESRPKTSR